MELEREVSSGCYAHSMRATPQMFLGWRLWR